MADEKVTAEKKPAKTAKKKKSHKISGYFKDLKGEMGKITWYSAHDTLVSSAWVVVALAILTVIIGGVNLGFGRLVALLGEIF